MLWGDKVANSQGLLRIFGISFALATLAACTAKQPEVSRMSIAIPAVAKASNSAQSLQLGHLVVNVSGPGITSTILYTWDACNGGCGGSNAPTPVPSEFALEVPTGKSRLVQVLAVYQDSTSNLTSFFYGDQTADLAKVEESVKVTVTDLTGGLPLISGAISGRYLDTATTGPSGEVHVKYQPPGDRPSLIIEKGGIANGWFNLFALKGIPLRYVIPETGRDIFGQAVDLGDRTIFAPSNKVAKIFVPVSTRLENGVPYNEREAETHVIGYFGPGAGATRAVCREIANNDPTDGRLVYGTSTPMTFGVISSNTAAEPTNLSNTTTPATQIQIQGGVVSGAAPCSGYLGAVATNVYNNFLPLRAHNFKDGREGIGGFFYPFGFVNKPTAPWAPADFNFDLGNAASPLQVDTSSTLKFGGRFLPGMGAILNGLRVYRIPATGATQMEDMEFAPCGEIRAGDRFGSVPIGTGTVNAAGGFYAATSLPAANLTSAEGIAICFDSVAGPVKRGVYLDSSRLSGGPSGPYLRVEGLYDYRHGNSNFKPLTNGKCYPISIKTYASGGNPAPSYNVTADVTASFASGVYEYFVDQPDCEASVSAQTDFVITSGTNETQLFMRVNGTGNGSAPINLTINSTEVGYSSDGPFNYGNPKVKFALPTTAGASVCYSTKLLFFESDGMTPYPTSDLSGLTVSATGSGSRFTNACGGGAVSSISSSGNEESNGFFFTSLSSGSETLSVSGLTSPWEGVSHSITVAGDSNNFAIQLILDQTALNYNSCVPARVVLKNVAGGVVAAPFDIEFSLETAGSNGDLGFYQDPMCSIQFPPHPAIPQGETQNVFWVRPLTNRASYNVAVKSPSVNDTGTVAITVGTPPAEPYFTIVNSSAMRQVVAIGSHDFDGSRIQVPIVYNGTLTCTKNAGADDCTSQIEAGNVFRPTFDDVHDDVTYEIQGVLGGVTRYWQVHVSDFFGPEVEVIQCDGAELTTTPISSSSAFATGVNCLAPGVNITLGTGDTVDLADKAVIGSVAGTNSVTGTDSNLFQIDYVSVSAGGLRLANLTLNVPSNSQGFLNMASTISDGEPIGVRKLTLQVPATTRGLQVNSGEPMRIADIQINAGTSADDSGIYVTDSSGVLEMDRVKVNAAGASTTFAGVRLYADTSTTIVSALRGYDYSGPGYGLYVDGSNALASVIAEFVNIVTGNGVPLKFINETDVTLRDFRLVQNASVQPAIYLFPSTASLLSLKSGRVISQSSESFILMENGSVGDQDVYLTNTHWMSFGAAKAAAYKGPSSGTTLYIDADGGLVDPSNRICQAAGAAISAIDAQQVSVTANLPGVAFGQIRTAVAGENSCR